MSLAKRTVIMNNLEHIKELLYTGQRSAISTKDFESIIEQLETSQSRVKELEKIINRLSKEVNAPYTLDDFISITKLERKLEIAEEYLDVIFRGYHFTNDIESFLRSLAEQALQKMKEVK